jgi:hypothetical protein
MSNVIELSAYRRAEASLECQRKVEIAMAIEMLQQRGHFFERHEHISDFRRGAMCAAAMIEHPQFAERIEAAFKYIIEEAMRRRAKGGKNSRKPWTPASDGFLFGITRYVATGKVYRPKP